MTVVCELCGGPIRRIRKLDYDRDPRWWCECVDQNCRHAGWDMGSDRDAWQRRMRRERERERLAQLGVQVKGRAA